MAIDIEAAVKDSSLDIGVFGSRQQISDEEAVELVAQLVSCLGEIEK